MEISARYKDEEIHVAVCHFVVDGVYEVSHSSLVPVTIDWSIFNPLQESIQFDHEEELNECHVGFRCGRKRRMKIFLWYMLGRCWGGVSGIHATWRTIY